MTCRFMRSLKLVLQHSSNSVPLPTTFSSLGLVPFRWDRNARDLPLQSLLFESLLHLAELVIQFEVLAERMDRGRLHLLFLLFPRAGRQHPTKHPVQSVTQELALRSMRLDSVENGLSFLSVIRSRLDPLELLLEPESLLPPLPEDSLEL